MEQGRRLPDPKDKLEACYRAVIETVASRKSSGRLAIGGKSMGGRIASQVAAGDAPAVAGLVLLGYPLHPPGKPDQLRAKHLPRSRPRCCSCKARAIPSARRTSCGRSSRSSRLPAELFEVAGGDHSFKVLKRAGVSQEDTYKMVLDRIEQWLRQTLAA